jgi:RNA polymerase sigma factor (sigma-70 family)
VCAIAAIYEIEYPLVFAYCLKRTGNWHMAEDLTSATFERALPLLPHANPHALLLRIAQYLVLDHWRRERKRRTWSFADVFRLPEEHYAVLAIDGGMDRIVESCDTAMAAAFLAAALRECSAADLQIIHLRFVQGLAAKEVAAHLNLTPQEYNKRQSALFYRLAQRIAPAPAKPHPTCLLCDGEIYGRGVCRYHYQHMREGKRIPLLPPKAQYRPTTCQECGKPHYSRGYCRHCYEHVRVQERMANRRAAGQLL